MVTLSAEHRTSPPRMSPELNGIMKLLMNLMVITLLLQPFSISFQSTYIFPLSPHFVISPPPQVIIYNAAYLAGFVSSVKIVFFTNFSHSSITHLQELKDSQISYPRPVVTCDGLLSGSTKFWHAICIAWLALANWMGSTRPWWPAWLFGSEMPTRYAAWKGRRKTTAQAL